MTQGQREEWLKEVAKRNALMQGVNHSESAPLMLALRLLAEDHTYESWGCDDDAAWLVEPPAVKRSRSRVFVVFFSSTDYATHYARVREWLFAGGRVQISMVAPAVQQAFKEVKGVSITTELIEAEFLVNENFSISEGVKWGGSKWKSMRRELRNTKATLVRPSLTALGELDSLWARQWEDKGKALGFRHVSERDKRSQVRWFVDNEKYLSSLGITWDVFGWEVDGQLVSAQVFTPISGQSFYAFTHRMNRELIEGFMCYTEMDEAFQLPHYRGKIMNDSNAFYNVPLQKRKARYSFGIANQYNLYYDGAK